MKKLIYIYFVLSLLFVCGCKPNNDEIIKQIQTLNQKIDNLEKKANNTGVIVNKEINYILDLKSKEEHKTTFLDTYFNINDSSFILLNLEGSVLDSKSRNWEITIDIDGVLVHHISGLNIKSLINEFCLAAVSPGKHYLEIKTSPEYIEYFEGKSIITVIPKSKQL